MIVIASTHLVQLVNLLTIAIYQCQALRTVTKTSTHCTDTPNKNNLKMDEGY
ncbi:hypothetical protein PISMIDRAFT_672069 [Pisolithus microcarpus 441]|uniref:Uncharacterized protein n=1 Tax=Pisolithus microcarpus 441 TaxID=765257 RepID=A0A0D0ABI9_9AGAM|nr:hypothetical protein PISMIDRAFT_672069 [Pisolithus microcarpus 441]